MADKSGVPSYETWHKFFSDLANGALPYLQLYAKRSQRGSGLGGHKGSHRRFQVPVPQYTSQTGQGTNNVKLVSPSQQSVDMARALLKHEDDTVPAVSAPIKRRKPRAKVQKTSDSAPGKTKKPPTTTRKRGTGTAKGKKKNPSDADVIFTEQG